MNSSAYSELLKRRPFGWVYDDPPTFESFEFERIDPFYWHAVIEGSWTLVFYAGALYIGAIYGLQKLMKNRPAYELTIPLFIWNLSLGIFSIVGFFRVVPELLHVISQPGGFYRSICVKSGLNVPSMYWGVLFAISKFWELGDTIFLVLRKRPVVFLQWYHHLVTMSTVWLVAPLVEPIIRWYAVSNFAAHSLMYPYFSLKSIGIRVPTGVAKFITTIQLAQMIIGFTVNMTSLYLLLNGHPCERYPSSVKIFCFVYGSFILLFGKLFYESVMKTTKGKHKKLS